MSNLINLGNMLVRADNIASIDIADTDVLVTFHHDNNFINPNEFDHPRTYRFTAKDQDCETFEELERSIRNTLVDVNGEFYTIAINTKSDRKALFFPEYVFGYATVTKENNSVKLTVNDRVYHYNYDNSVTGFEMINSENTRFNSAFVALAHIEHVILNDRKDRSERYISINVNKNSGEK